MSSKKKKKSSWNFFYILVFSFLFIGSASVWLGKEVSLRKRLSFKRDSIRAFSLVKTDDFPEIEVKKTPPPTLTANSVLVVDLNSGITLYEKNPDEPVLPASTTKILTALVALDYYPLDEVLEVGSLSVDGQKMHLVKRERITVRDLLYGLLVFSANDAAEVLAQNFPGGRNTFVASMNYKAKELDLEHTYLSDPAGLSVVNHYTTARDLVKASIVALKNPFFKEAVRTKEITVESIDKRFVHKLKNINELLWEVDGVLGVKTGWTPDSRENLVTYIKRGDKDLLIAILGSQDRFNETKSLIDWVFSSDF